MAIKQKRSLVTGSIPTTASLAIGELAMNIPDGRIFFRKSGSGSDTVQSAITTGAQNSGSVVISGSLSLYASTGSVLDISGDIFEISGDVIEISGDTMEFTGSFTVTGSSTVTGSLRVTNGITGSLLGTASFATSASFAVSASWAPGGSSGLSNFISTGSVTASVNVSSTNAFNVVSASNTLIQVTSNRTLLVGDATQIPNETAWKSPGVFGSGSANKVLAGYLVSTTNGATIGANNSNFTSWADLNIAGTNLIFRSAETEYMRLASTGNFGIGVTNPGAKLHVAGAVSASAFTGSLLGTASFATSASRATTASYALQAISSSFASTASSADNFTVRNTLTAQTIVVQTITSSVDFVTGSTRFGSLTSNTHLFTGSVGMTGSLTVVGPVNASSFTGSLLGTSSYAINADTLDGNHASVFVLNSQTSSFATTGSNIFRGNQIITGSVNITGSDLTLTNSGNTQATITATNTTAGTTSAAQINVISTNGGGQIQKRSSSTTTYKILTPNNLVLYNDTAGDIAILNDAAGGNIKFAANGASTPQLFLSASGRVGIGTTAPSNNLHVVGTSFLNGDVTLGDGVYFDDLNNRLGIGVSSPTQVLDVAAPFAVAKFTSATGTNSAFFQYVNTGGNFFLGTEDSTGATFGATAYAGVVYHSARELEFFPAATRRMALKTTGQLQLHGYTSTTSFTGTAAGVLAFDSSGNILTIATPGGGSGSPGGANTSIQFNDGGAFSGSGDFTFNKTLSKVRLNGDFQLAENKSLYFENSLGVGSGYISYTPTNYGASNGQDLTISNGANGVIKYNAGLTTASTSSAHLWSGVSGDQMILNASGNLGIGTGIDPFDPFNFPKAKLHVQASGSALLVVSGSQGQLFRVIDSGSASSPILATMSSGSRNVFTFTTSSLIVTGSVIANIETDALHYGRIVVTPSTNQNDYSPTGWNDADPFKATTINISAGASIKITGLAGGAAGRIAVLKNTSTDRLVILEDESTSSTAANRFDFRNPIFLLPNGSITLIYDAVDSRWQPQASSGGIGFGAFFDNYDDFIGGVSTFTTTATEVGRFAGIGAGTGASGQAGTYLVNTTEKPLGVYQIDTGTTSTGRAILGSTDGASVIPANGQAVFLCRIAVESLSTGTDEYQIFAGFQDSVGATNVTDGVYWQYVRTSSTSWQGATANNSTRTITGAAGPTVDTNYIWLGIYINPTWSRATYFYSTDSRTWTMAGEITTNLPTAARSTGLGITINKTVGTNQRNCSIDLMAVRYDITRG